MKTKELIREYLALGLTIRERRGKMNRLRTEIYKRGKRREEIETILHGSPGFFEALKKGEILA